MKIEYDKDVDAFYFHILDSKVLESEEVSPGIIYDYDENNNLVGVEVLSVREKTPEEIRAINFPFSENEKAIFREFFLNAFA